MRIVKATQARVPVRIDFAGGTLDIWPLGLALRAPAVTVNAALDLPITARIEPLPGTTIVLRSEDLDREARYTDGHALEAALEDGTCPLALLGRAVVASKPDGGFSLTSHAALPAGSGLGGSSALATALVGCLWAARGHRPGLAAIQALAQDVETRLLRTTTGYQDYMPPLYGGCLALTRAVGGLDIARLDVDLGALEARLRLAYTGEPHESGITNWGVVRAYLDGEAATADALETIALEAGRVAEALRAGDLDAALAAMLADGRARRTLAPGVTTPGIEALDETMRAAGALGTKICGAGGGGCVLILLPDPALHPHTGDAVDVALAAGPWEPLSLRLTETGLVLEPAGEDA